MNEFQHVDVRGEGLSIFLIESCEMFLSLLIQMMYIPYYNEWSVNIDLYKREI